MSEHKWVYDFAEGSREMRTLLGGKGANVAEMTRVLGSDRVPAGFTITTEACVAYMREGRDRRRARRAGRRRARTPPGRRCQALRRRATTRCCVSVRSGARDSMPGMMDTILNLGLNDQAVEGLATATENPHFAWDSYRRLVQMFGNVVFGVDGGSSRTRSPRSARSTESRPTPELPVEALQELVERFKGFYEFPQDPQEQLRKAIDAVFQSWMGERAVQYRRIKHGSRRTGGRRSTSS